MSTRPPFSALLRELVAAHAHWATIKLQQAAQRLDNATWTLRNRRADTCRVVDVDGEPIRYLGQEMTDEERAAFAEVVRAAKRRLDEEAQRP